jgi:hypothetical protein
MGGRMAGESTQLFTDPGFPDSDVPSIFSDGITAISPGQYVVKMYLGKVDPDVSGSPKFKVSTTQQLIMPINSFVQAAAFMNNVIETLVESKKLSAEDVKSWRALAGKFVD